MLYLQVRIGKIMEFREVVFPTNRLQGKNYQCTTCREMILLPSEKLSKLSKQQDLHEYIDKVLKEHICIDYGYPNKDRFYVDDQPGGRSKR